MDFLQETLRAMCDHFASALAQSTEDNVESPQLGVVAIVAEVLGENVEDGHPSTAVTFFCSDGRTWVQRGLFAEAIRVATHVAECA